MSDNMTYKSAIMFIFTYYIFLQGSDLKLCQNETSVKLVVMFIYKVFKKVDTLFFKIHV